VSIPPYQQDRLIVEEHRQPEVDELPSRQRANEIGKRVEASTAHHLRRAPRSVLST
jgi:hypothetical protein